MNEPAKRASLVLFSVLIALAVGEMLARAVYTKPWYLRLVEEQSSQSSKITHGRDPYGLRDLRPFQSKTPDIKRVLVLGDSFTYGYGIADDSAVFPSLLEEKLNTEFLSMGKKVEILNGGLNASLTDQWVDLLLEKTDDFKPDVVLIVFFLRDGTQLSSIRDIFNPMRDDLTKNKPPFLYRHSYLFRSILDRFDRAHFSRAYFNAMHKAYFGDVAETREWENAKANILKIQSTGNKRHVKVGLVVFPVLVELEGDYPFEDVYEHVLQFGMESGMPTYGLLPAFKGKNAFDLWVSPCDQHPNEEGHRIAAESILPFLRELLVSSDQP